MKQRTLKSAFSLSGKGLHTGLHIDATFKPAEVNTGYVIVRVDLEGNPRIEAVAENVICCCILTVELKSPLLVNLDQSLAAVGFVLGEFACLRIR